MRRSIILCAAGLGLLAALSIMLLSPAGEAEAQQQSTRVRVAVDEGVLGTAGYVGLPPNCTSWHEISPTFCVDRHQDAYADNGDGEISVCDNITLDGVVQHIDRVDLVYTLADTLPGPVPGPERLEAETSQGPHNPSSPVCEIWHVVYSTIPGLNYCDLVHVAAWQNLAQNGRLSTGDIVEINGEGYIVMGYDISVESSVGPIGDIPTLNEWGLLVLLVLLVGAGAFFIARRNRAIRV